MYIIICTIENTKFSEISLDFFYEIFMKFFYHYWYLPIIAVIEIILNIK